MPGQRMPVQKAEDVMNKFRTITLLLGTAGWLTGMAMLPGTPSHAAATGCSPSWQTRVEFQHFYTNHNTAWYVGVGPLGWWVWSDGNPGVALAYGANGDCLTS